MTLDQAVDAIRSWYYTEVRDLAEDAVKRCKAKGFTDEESAREWLIEDVDATTDDHAFVIYTFKAKCVLLASDNDDAYRDEIGERAAACLAMRRDVWDHLDGRLDECWAADEETGT